jgi:oligopeptide/dipeptide ABC transporter ATP-binding protein
MDNQPILRVEGLMTEFRTEHGTVKAVDNVSFELRRSETLGIVGESGCGKSVTNLSVLKLVKYPLGRITDGKVIFKEDNLLNSSGRDIRSVRGKHISMIFQDPLTSLNPVIRIWFQIAEALIIHHGLGKKEAKAKSVEMLKLIGIPDAERCANGYPHELSGGMRQRVMIAMALSCDPEILIADEPTTALDVTIQAQILDLIKNLSSQKSTAVIMVTHDLGVVAGTCDSVCVMYAGRIVESATTDDLFYDPKHPYTRGLLDSIPRIDRVGNERLYSIPGAPPSLINMPGGCPFRPRCDRAMPICSEKYPSETDFSETHTAACWLYVKEN